MHSSFREGAKLYSDREAIRNFMTRAPYFTINNLEESKPILGGITSVLVRFNKRVFVFSRFDEYVVAVGLDMEVHTPLPDLIEKLVKTAAASSPDSLLSREVTVTSQLA